MIPSAPDMQISIRRSLLNQYRFFSVSLIIVGNKHVMTIVRLNDDYENEFMIRSCGFSSTQVLLEVPGRGNSGYFAVAIKSTEVRICIK